MPVDPSLLNQGTRYSREELATLWGYKGIEAIARGVVTPARDNKILLFVTHEKRKGDTQYEDHFENGILVWEGEQSHQNDRRMLESFTSNDEIYLFYRERHEDVVFEYLGEYYLVDARLEDDRPSSFRLSPAKQEGQAGGMAWTEASAHGALEGGQKYRFHSTYERNSANRAKAIEIHGCECYVCGFDFDKTYGSDLAHGYVEVHHVLPLSKEKRHVDPAKDLIPVCSNCHSMLHRKAGEVLSVDKLSQLLTTRNRE